MKISTTLAYSGNPREAATQVIALEQAGLDAIFVPEAYGFDSPTMLGYLAARTERVALGSSILNVFSRTPSALLQTAAGLDNVSQGRAILGLGASGPQVIEGFHGVPYRKPLARIEETVALIRRGLHREVLVNDGLFKLPLTPEHGACTPLGKPLKLLNPPQRPELPIYLAALGPKSVEQAASIADGWIPHLFHPERFDAVWGPALRAGLDRRSPELGPLQIVAGGSLAFTDDEAEASRFLDQTRSMYALYVGGMGARGKNFYNDLAHAYGYGKEAEEIQDLYLSGKKNEAEAVVPQEWLQATNLIGSEGRVKDRLQALAAAGVSTVHVKPLGSDPVGSVARLRELVDGL